MNIACYNNSLILDVLKYLRAILGSKNLCHLRNLCDLLIPQEAANLLNLFNHREAVCF